MRKQGWERGLLRWFATGSANGRGIQSLGKNRRDALVKSVLYLMELLKIFIR